MICYNKKTTIVKFMFNKINLIIFILITFSFNSFASNTNNYHCELTIWGSMSKNLKTWFPKKFFLYPNEPSIQIDINEWYQKYNAVVKTHTKTRLEMVFYDSEATLATSKLKSETNKYSITYLPLVDKVNVIMRTPGYLPAGPVYGTCDIKTSSIGSATKSKKSNNSNSTLNNQSSS